MTPIPADPWAGRRPEPDPDPCGGGRARRALLVGVLAGSIVGVAVAQPPAAQPPAPAPPPQPPVALTPDLDRFEGRVIRAIHVAAPSAQDPEKYEPVSASIEQLIRNNLRLEVGRPFSAKTATDDVNRLTRLPGLETVESWVAPLGDGVAVTLVVQPEPVIADVQSVGNRLLSDQEIIDAVDAIIGTPVDRFQIDRACRQIEDLYRRKGYYLAQVSIDEKALEESGILLLRIREGERTRVTDIRFEGNASFSARELRNQIRTKTAFPIFEKGPLDDDVLAQDAAALVSFYRDRGYLDARADRRWQPSPDNREAIVTFMIEEGPVYTLRGVRVRYVSDPLVFRYRTEILQDPAAPLSSLTPEQARAVGAGLLAEPQALGLMAMKPGDVYGVRKLRDSVRAVEEFYDRLGYGEAEVDARELRDLDRPEVELILQIVEGPRSTTGEIKVIGDTITRQDVIIREVRVQPGRPLDFTALEETRDRLTRLNLFAPGSIKVEAQPEVDGQRDVLVEIEDTTTGQINFGVAADTDAGVTGLLAIRERNFDIANLPGSFDELFGGGAFRGAGQEFAIELQPGDRYQQYSISLSEPHVFGTESSLSGKAFYLFNSFDQYDEERYGGRVGIGRAFGSRLRADLAFRNEWVSLSDLEIDAPADYFAATDTALISGLGLFLSRNTTDNVFVPTRGTIARIGIEQVGLLGSDYDFTKLSASYDAYYTLNESFSGMRTILSWSVEADYIPQGMGDVPVYERYFKGGRSLRGLDFRTVSPRGFQLNGLPADDPIGGTWAFTAGVELQQPVHDIIALVGFVDSGTVLEEFGFDDYRVTAGVGVRITWRGVSQVPLAFDFGFPIMSEGTDDERLFTFSLDIPWN